MMDWSRLRISTGARILWLALGLLLGGPTLVNGIQTGSTADLCFGIGMLLVGVRGFLRPVMFGKAVRMEMDPRTSQVSIGSPMLHGGLSLVIFAALTAGIVIKYVIKG
ncbi:hypothetical protein LK542_08380 [Massilia sp. IC2-477]|uniref:hypothetical protein n=1 Tax=Massilia sp. IC2-477 TaxID=2887198 RepID=UPI001D1278EB|nr:hypothetical protein [Massilia sp. IC2-477]MCC2955627.1 hypothetical protein [Massilia sp. IC2-477]